MRLETEYPEIDERGKRFRRVGQHCIEYAPSMIVHAPAPPEAPQRLPLFRGNVPEVQRELCFL